MHVLTLNNDSFAQHCRDLQALAADFAPDLVVAIANGGVMVGDGMFDTVPHVAVKCQRASTSTKEKHGVLRWALRHLPRAVNNLLRIAEAKVLAWRGVRDDVGACELANEVRAAVSRAKRVLVVDDAVDSGTTLKTVLAAIAAVGSVDAVGSGDSVDSVGSVDSVDSAGGERVVRSAVITVTTQNPLVKPDYTLYNNRTLIRFPWSADAN